METFSGDLADLRSLCAVIEQGSITQAAQVLGESKSSISRRITRLEEQLALKLLHRSSRVVSPTEAGMTFYHRSLQALALLDEGATELRNSHQVPSGLLRVTMPTDVGLSLCLALMADFLKLYPQIQVNVSLTEAILDLKAHQIDVALRAARTLPDSTYIFHRLTSLGFHLFASPQYLATWGTPRDPTELAHHALLLHHRVPTIPLYNLPFYQGNRQFSVKLKARIISNDFAYLQQMATLGVGIALIPEFLGTNDAQFTQEMSLLVRVLPQWEIGERATLYLLHEELRHLPSKVTCFRDFVCDRFRAKANF
jgi:DNA-binding transcriptional LysR family regulator